MIKANKTPLVWLVILAFSVNTLITGPVFADVPFLPAPGRLVPLTPSFSPPIILGLKVFKNNPFKFEFVMSEGDRAPGPDSVARRAFLKAEGDKLVKYFLASLTIPQKDMWVNLSPYEHDRIIAPEFGITEMGKQMLAQDYLLKQVTASVMYPNGAVGREFWGKIYREAYKRFGTTNIPVSTFNKVWILPDKAEVYENQVDNTAVIIKSSLKVMLEEDYLALRKSSLPGEVHKDSSADRQLSNELIRQIILPLIEKEVNTGKNFAGLRQVYNSLILAFWYKNKLKESLISKGYVNRKKIHGVEVKDKNIDEEIYRQYLKSYKKGVYNFIKEEVDPSTQETIPRKYFSGGIVWDNLGRQMSTVFGRDSAQAASLILKSAKTFELTVGLEEIQHASSGNPLYLDLNSITSSKPLFSAQDITRLNEAITDTRNFLEPEPVEDAAMLGTTTRRWAAALVGLALLAGANTVYAKGAYDPMPQQPAATNGLSATSAPSTAPSTAADLNHLLSNTVTNAVNPLQMPGPQALTNTTANANPTNQMSANDRDKFALDLRNDQNWTKLQDTLLSPDAPYFVIVNTSKTNTYSIIRSFDKWLGDGSGHDPQSYIDFVYGSGSSPDNQPNVTFKIRVPPPASQGKVDISTIDSWTQIVNPDQIKQIQLDRKTIYVQVFWKDKDGHAQSGVVYAGPKAALTVQHMMNDAQLDNDLTQKILKITSIPDYEEQINTILKTSGLPEAGTNDVSKEGGIIVGAYVQRDQFGSITSVTGWIHARDIDTQIVKGTDDKPHLVLYNNGKDPQILKYWPYGQDIDVFSVLTPAELNMLHDPQTADLALNKYLYNLGGSPLERGGIVFGKNKYIKKMMEVEAQKAIAEHDKQATKEYLHYLKVSEKADLLFSAASGGLSAVGINAPVNAVGDILVDMKYQPEKIGQYVPTAEELQQLFNEYNAQQPKEDQVVLKNGRFETVKGFYTQRDIELLDGWLVKRNKEKTAAFILQQVSRMAVIASYYTPTKTKSSGAYRFQVPENDALYHFLAQDVGSFLGEFNVAGLYNTVSSHGLQYVSLGNLLNKGSFLNKLTSVLGVTINGQSLINEITGRKVFELAPSKTRINFYVLGFPISHFFEEDLVANIDKILNDRDSYAFIVKDGHFRSVAVAFTKDQFQALYKSAVPIGKISNISPVDGRPMSVPVYEVETISPSGEHIHQTMVFTLKALEQAGLDVRRDLERYDNFTKMLNEGGAVFHYGSDGGTLSQNIYTGLFKSFSQQGMDDFPSAYTFDQAGADRFFIEMGNFQSAKWNLDFFFDVMKAQLKLSGQFQGLSKSYNAYNGADASDQPDIGGTSMMAQTIMAYEKSTGDKKYHLLLTESIKWLLKVQKENGGKALPDTPGGHLFNPEPNAIAFAALHNFGTIYNDKDALLAADQIRQWAAGLWDKENFLIKSPNGNYPADNNTRWLQALGPKAFMETFLDNDPVKLGKFLRAMEKTFGVTVINYHTGQTVHLLDLADQQKADGRLTNDQHTPNHRIGFPEVTAEFLQGLIDSRPYLTREDAAFADQLIAKYSGQLQAMTDRNGNLPQATDKGKDSGYNGLTILGNHSLASGVQYQFMVLGLDPLHLDGPRGNALGLKPDKIEIPPVLSFNTLNQGAVIKPGETNYLQMSRYFNQLIIDEHAHHNRNLIYHDPINNLHFVYINTADHIVDARLIPSPKEIQKQVVLAGEDAQMTALKSQALNGQGAFPHGGVIFQTPDGKRLGMLRGVEGQSDAVEDVLSAVGQLPVQEQSFINYKGFSNFMLHNYKVDGVHQDVMVTVVFPLHKSIVHDVKDDHNVITTSIYEGGRLRFIINDNTTTVMNYDDATGVESTTTSYHNFAGGREAMVKMLSDSSKPLAERQALFNGQHPSNKTTTVWAGYIDPTLSMDRVDPNEVWIIKRSTNLDTGHVTTQGYGLFTRPVWEADQFTVTENHFDQSGSFTHAEQFQNTGTLQTPQKGQELFEIKVLDPNEIKGLPQQFTEKQQQAHQSLVYKKDVIHGTESLMVMDNENYGRYTAKYTADQFTNPEGQTSKLSTVLIPEYRPDFMGGQVPYVTREYSGAGKLMKESLTISIDAVTQVTTVQEKNMRTGEVIEKNIEPLFGNSLTESKMDSLGRQEIVSNVYSNDYLHVSSTTVIGGTLAVETKGTYNQAAQQWTLEQTRWNYSRNAQQEKVPVKYETVRSVLSAGGHLIYEDTMFPQNVYEINGHTYTENDRRFIPEYDVNGNISRSTEGIIANGVFTPKEIMEYSDYGDFFAARQSFTKRIINGKEIIYSTSRLLTTPAEYQKSGKLRFEVTSKVYDKADDPATWIETTDRDGHLVEKSLQVYDGQNLVGEQVTSFSNFNVQNIPAQSTTFIRQGAANEVLSTSIDKTSLEEARLGLERTEITNQFNGLVRQELRDRRGRVIENDIEGVDPVTGRQEVQRKTVFYNFNEFDIAVDSVTKSLLEGTFTPYTTSKLLSDYNDILTNHSIRFHVHNDFLSSTANSVDWQEVKDYHGHVIELDKGHMNPNGQFEATRKITSTYQGIPGLIDVANSTRTVMVIDGKPGLLTDQSHLITAHGVTIDAHNINTIPAQDIFNGVHKVRYQGISYFTELEGMTSTDRDYQEIRNSLGNVEVTLFGTVDPQGHFNKNRSLYRVYGTTENNFSNFDIAKATVTTVGDKGHEEVVSYSNNTHITDDDRYLIYKTKKGLGAQGLVLTNDVFANLGAITAQVSGPEHQLDLTHLTETISQVKDSEGRVIFTFSGFPSLNINGFGTGNPVFVTVNQYQENRISQPVAAHSQTYFWKKAMGDYDPTDNFNQLKNYIHNNHPTVIASLDNLMFDKGVATYKTDDMREVGLRTVSMRLDGTMYRNSYQGSGVDGPALFNLYFDEHELPSYGMEIGPSGIEKPFSIYRPTLFNYGTNLVPYVLIDEFRSPEKGANNEFDFQNQKPHASILMHNGTIQLVRTGSAVRTTPFSSMFSLGDLERNGVFGKAVRLIHETDPEKIMDAGHQQAQSGTAQSYVSSSAKKITFEQETWGQKAAWLGQQAGFLLGSLGFMYAVVLAARIFGFSTSSLRSLRKKDINSASQQNFEDLGFTKEQSQIILDERFRNGAFLSHQDFKDRLGVKLSSAHKLSEKWLPKMIAKARFWLAMQEVSWANGEVPAEKRFNTQDSLRLAAAADDSVVDFMAELKGLYGLKPEQQASYESALRMFGKYLKAEQLRDIVNTPHFRSLVDHYSKQRAAEVILKLMFEKIRDNQDYKNAVRQRVDDIISSTGMGREFPDQIFALKDTFLKNIENARLLPEGLRFHDFDISTDLLAYSWDDLRKGPDMERQVRSDLVSIEKLFVFQVIFQRALFGLAGQGRAEEYLWAKYVWPSINKRQALNDPDILQKIKAFKQVFHALLLDEVNKRLEGNRDPKGKVLYFQNIVNEEVYNDAFRYLLGQKDPTLADAGWTLSDDVKKKTAPIREKLEKALADINEVIELPSEQRAEEVKTKAEKIKPLVLAYVGAVDQQIGMPVLKGRLSYWQLTVNPLLKILGNKKMRQRIFSKGGPYNQSAHDLVRRLNHYIIFGSVAVMFAGLTLNLFSVFPFMVPPSFIMAPWSPLLAGAAATVTSFVGSWLVKKRLISSLNKKLKNVNEEQNKGKNKEQQEKVIKSFGSKVKYLYLAQAGLVLGSLLLMPTLAPALTAWLGIAPQMLPVAPFIRFAIHLIPVMIFIDTWRLSFYAMNHLVSAMALQQYYATNNVYEINNKSRTDKITGRLMALFKDTAPALGTVYKTRGQERLASFVNVVDEMTSEKDNYFFAKNIDKQGKSSLTAKLSQLAGELVDAQGKPDADKIRDLQEEIETFVEKVAIPINVEGKTAAKSEKLGLQKLVDFVNHNYRLDKGANPSTWGHVIPTTVAIIGYSEDWYFTNGELLDINRGTFEESTIIGKFENSTTGHDVLDKLLKHGILLQEGLMSRKEEFKRKVRVNVDLSDKEIKQIALNAGIDESDFNKIAPLLKEWRDAQNEAQEFTHRLGMLAKYKTELFLLMVNRLTKPDSLERTELLKMIDDPTHVPEGILDWEIWPQIQEWANLQLPTGYANAVTQKRTLMRLYTHYARIFGVANPEAAAEEKIRVIDRNLMAMDALNKVLIHAVAKTTFIKEFTQGEQIFNWLMGKGYFYNEGKKQNPPVPPVDGLPKPLTADSKKKLKEQFPGDYERIVPILEEAGRGRLREMLDVLIETGYQDTYKVYPDGTSRGVKDPYKLIKDNQDRIMGGIDKIRYDIDMLTKLMDSIKYDRLFPARLKGGGVDTADLLTGENYHGAKWNQKTAILPFLVGPVILNLDADHRANYVDYESLPNHLLDYNYWPGLAVSTPIVKHTLTKGLGVFGNILPVSENAFYYHAQQAKELFGGLTATGKLFERVSALRHSEGVTDSYVAEDALSAINYRRFGYVTGRAGAVKVEKGWPFSFAAASTPTRKWSYDSVESVSGRTAMKVYMSPLVDWPFLVNNFWLDGFGFYFKKPGIVRYLRWLVAFYLVMDWNLFSNIPLSMWVGSMMLSQSISQGLFFYKIFDESRGYVKGTLSALGSIAARMYSYFVHQVFVFEETVGKLAPNRLGKFLSTASKGSNQTRIQNKDLMYVRSNYAIKSASVMAGVTLTLIGLSLKKSGLWALTLGMGFAGVAAPFLLNPVRIRKRVKDNFSNGKDIGGAFVWGLTDNVEMLMYYLSGLLARVGIKSFRSTEDDLQIKVLDMVQARVSQPLDKIPTGKWGTTFKEAFGQQAEAAAELAEYIYLFHQKPSHYRSMYGRSVLPAVNGLLKILANNPGKEGTDYSKKILGDELGAYKEALGVRFKEVKQYLEVFKHAKGYEKMVRDAEKQLAKADEILKKTSPSAKQLNRADWLLTQLSWIPMRIQRQPGTISKLRDQFLNTMIGVDAVSQLVAFAWLPLRLFLDRITRTPKTVENEKKALEIPKSTVVPLAPKAAEDKAMASSPKPAGVNRIAKITNPGGIDLSKTRVKVSARSTPIKISYDDPALLRLLLNADGLAPIIYSVRTMTPSMADHFVGLDY